MFFYLIMSNTNLIRLLNEITNNHLFYRWPINHYRNYISNIITTSNTFGSNYVYNKFERCKLPFVIFRTDDTFYYIDKNNTVINVKKLDKSFCVLDEFNLGHKSCLGFVLQNVLKKV